MPERVAPAAEVLLYDSGSEGYPIEEGYDIYDIPARRINWEREGESGFGRPFKDWSYTPSYRNINNVAGEEEPEVMTIKELSVVCPKPRVVIKDTPTSEWTTLGGAWENIKPLYPLPRKNRLVQRSSEANVVWRADSKWVMNSNPNLAFTIQRLDQHHNQNNAQYPGYVQVIIADTWAIRFSDSQSAGIWVKVAGVWQQARHINISARTRELMVWFTVRRGAICISFNVGERWEVIRGDTAVSVPAGQLSVEGSGCQMAFGVHNLVFDDCFFDSYELPILEEKLGSPFPELVSYTRPTGTSITLIELSANPASFRYRCKFKVSTTVIVGSNFTWYVVPEIYALNWSWPVYLHAPVGSSVDLVSIGVIDKIQVTEHKESTSRSGELNIIWDHTLFTGSYGLRVVRIKLGYYLDNGTFALTTRCHMYIIEPKPIAKSGNWDNDITFELVDLWIRASTTKVDEGWRPLDGYTVLAARDYILLKMGLPLSRRSWLDTGKVLLSGNADNPRWWPKPGMSAAELFQALDIYEDTETFIDKDGIWGSRVARFITPAVQFTFDGDGIDKTKRVKELMYSHHHREVKTAVMVENEDNRFGGFWATSINYALERLPAQTGFTGHRRWERYDNIPVTSLAEAIIIADRRRALHNDVPQLPEIKIPGEPSIYRGDRIKVINAQNTGIGGTEEFLVEALDFSWTPSLSTTETEIRARRVN